MTAPEPSKHGSPVQLGRDAAVCRLVYQDGTPGVSSKHCQVCFDQREGVFVVTDLNSTYGTFLSNGQDVEYGDAPLGRLLLRQGVGDAVLIQQGQHLAGADGVEQVLPPKSAFYLGETDNTVCTDLE